jgi:hypothetical protein
MIDTAATGPARHRWFHDWRSARTDALRAIVTDARETVAAAEDAASARQRKRREVDQRRHDEAVEVIVANLAHAVLLPPDGGRLAILTGNGTSGATRYDNPALGKPVRSILMHLEEAGLLTWTQSHRRGEASSVAPTERFAQAVTAAGITLRDIGRSDKEETIVLSQKTKLRVSDGTVSQRTLIDYAETAETTALRAEVANLNAFVEAADVGFVDDGRGLVDPFNRAQRRYFITSGDAGTPPSFDLSGRLFGGFWQNLKSDRRASVRLDGEPVATLDFSSMFPRLAFAAVGATPPSGDLYAIPGLENHRAAVKRALNCLLMDDFSRRSWPDELLNGEDGKLVDTAALMPQGWTVGRFKAALLRQHPALTPCLGAGLGLKLMNTESRILLAVLGEMRTKGIVGLGLHDGLLVARSRANEARSIMEMMGRTTSSVHLPVTLKSG